MTAPLDWLVLCSHHVSMTIPVLDSTQALSTHIEAAVTAETQRIRNSTALYEGSIPSSSNAVGEIALAPAISLLCQPASQDTAEPSSSQQATVSGRVVLEGVLTGHAFVHRKDTWDTAVDTLKVRSLSFSDIHAVNTHVCAALLPFVNFCFAVDINFNDLFWTLAHKLASPDVNS